ncbi:hypothetical protein [Lutimonas vermicola]|uniref:Uncharacterized protein n=1 Tax=Lutimonas vermicola TaxID=414288 RepID=A0ABU9KZJ6_9FLAO
MKSFLSILLFLILFAACKQEKGSPAANDKQSETKTTLKEQDRSVITKPSIFKTSTGKFIKLITEEKSSSLVDIKIIPIDFQNNKDTLRLTDIDPLQHAWIRDLDGNGYDELYLISASAGSGSYGTIYGFASNRDLSMTRVYVPEISEKDLLPDGNFYGYMGHDSIYTAENRIYRKYPIYKEGDANCCPSGGSKTLSYHLKAGEATWILAIEK